MKYVRLQEMKAETNDFFRKSLYLATYYNCPVILPGGTSYKTEKDEIADETWPIVRRGLTEIGADTDEMVNEAIRTGSPEVIRMNCKVSNAKAKKILDWRPVYPSYKEGLKETIKEIQDTKNNLFSIF